MTKIAGNIAELIGKTPLVYLNKIAEGSAAKIAAKLEFLNPTFSVKDRIGLSMIKYAETQGKLAPNTVIVEPTSGNTGIALASVCAVKGYKLKLVMPETMSKERQKLLSGLGAEVILTCGRDGMPGAVEKAGQIVKKNKNHIMLRQFENPANPAAHRRTTAREILSDTGGKIDILVAGIGTGGTITGIAEIIKKKKPLFKAIAVEPADSAKNKIQGIGPGFIPAVLNTEIIDEVIRVSNNQALSTAKNLMRREGILAGISSGAAVFAALKTANRKENKGKLIIVILPDSAERYLSTELFIP